MFKWTIHRFGLRQVRDHVLYRRVPKDPWYQGDGEAMLVLFLIQLLTGVVLALSYTPSNAEAYDSVVRITSQQRLGWFVRGLHYWSGGLWVVLLFFHLMRQIAAGGYKKPREGTWLTGVGLFVVVIVMSFIGYVLRWDQDALYALRVALNVFNFVPFIGDGLVRLTLGGEEIATATVTRLYALHVLVGPLLLSALIGYHVYLIIVHGTQASSESEQPIETVAEQKQVYKETAQHPYRGEQFFPNTIVRLSPVPLATVFLALGLTLIVGPTKLYPEADLTGAVFPHEEWWFSWYSALAALLPAGVAPYFHWLFPSAILLVLVALPFVDRWDDNRGARKRPIAVTVVCLIVLGVLWLSALRVKSAWTAWPRDEPPAVPAGIVLNDRAERGRHVFAAQGCNSCHAVAGDGPTFGPDMTHLRQRYSLAGIRQYVLEPPPGVAMPSYRGRISDEDLALVAEFCHVAQTFPRK